MAERDKSPTAREKYAAFYVRCYGEDGRIASTARVTREEDREYQQSLEDWESKLFQAEKVLRAALLSVQ